MFLLTGERQYLHRAELIYAWLKSSRVVGSTFAVHDGIAYPECVPYTDFHSYSYGILAGGLGYLYRASGNREYLNDATQIFNEARRSFTVNNVWTDPCEPRCALNAVSPKGTAISGFMHLYIASDNNELRESIRQVMEASANAMVALCDSDFNCPGRWSTMEANQVPDFHTQLNALALMTAAVRVKDISFNKVITEPKVEPPPIVLSNSAPKILFPALATLLCLVFV